jgi:hypothetical protein
MIFNKQGNRLLSLQLDLTLTGRTNMWIDLFSRENNFLGVGDNIVLELYRVRNYHNQFVEAFAKYGYVGFATIVILHTYYIKKSIQNGKTAYTLFFIPVIILSLLESTLFSDPVYPLFGFIEFMFFRLLCLECVNKKEGEPTNGLSHDYAKVYRRRRRKSIYEPC